MLSGRIKGDFIERTGSDDPVSYFDLDVREVSARAAPRDPLLFASGLPPDLPPGTHIDEFGVAAVTGRHSPLYARKVGGLMNAAAVADIESYPFPDPANGFDETDLRLAADRIHEEGRASAGFYENTIFEKAWYVRGMQNLLTDLILNPAMAEVLLDRITYIAEYRARAFARAGFDILRLGDHVGTQRGLLMGRETCRKWLLPRLKRVIEAAKQEKPDIIIVYHTCGSVTPLLEDFIEAGVDVFNPLQEECMDTAAVKRQFGDRLAFWGGIGTQSVLPFGTTKDVRRKVREIIAAVGEGGGLLVAPAHMIEPDVPWENVLALRDAVEEFGYYR